MKIGLIISVLLALLGVAIWWAVHAWTSLGEVEMSVHGYVAMILGITFSLRGFQAFLWNGSSFRLRLKKLALREGAGLDTDYTCCCASTCPPFCAWNSGRVLSLLKQQGVRI